VREFTQVRAGVPLCVRHVCVCVCVCVLGLTCALVVCVCCMECRALVRWLRVGRS
jgi:hypothetical protein